MTKNIAENNGMWRGDKVGMVGLHVWVKSRLPKPELCECCGRFPPIDLANKGIYNRELKNWEWLCRRCHMTKDGRLKKLMDNHKKYVQGVKLSPDERKEKSRLKSREWRKKHPDYEKQYYWKNDSFRNIKKEKWKEWYKKNKERRKEYQKKYKERRGENGNNE